MSSVRSTASSSNTVDCSQNSEPGLRFTNDLAGGTVFDSYTPTGVHRELFRKGSELSVAAVEAIRDIATGKDTNAFRESLEAAGLDILDGLLISLSTRTVRGDGRALSHFFELLECLGGKTTTDLPSTTDDMIRAVRLFELSTVTPTVRVRLNESFRQSRRDQQETIIEYLVALSQGVDVVIVGTEIDRAYLRTEFGKVLPSNVTDSCNHPHDSAPVDELTTVVGTDTLSTEILRTITDEFGGSIGYDELKAVFSQYDRSTLSRALNEDLLPNGLVDKYGKRGSQRLDVLQHGYDYVDHIEELESRQKTLSESVTDTPQCYTNSRVDTAGSRKGEGEQTTSRTRHRLPSYHTVDWLSQPETLAPIATTVDGGISLTNHPIGFRSDRAQGEVGFNHESGKLVVSVEYDNPMQYMVTVARTLLDSRVFDHALTEDRLSQLDEFVVSGSELLRGARCLGYLPDEIQTGCEYGDRLKDERDELLELTKQLDELDGDEERNLRGQITREAHGLAGTARHVFDLLDIEVVLEIRLPEFSRRRYRYGKDRTEMVAKTLSKHLSIASKYGHHVGHRLLYESRSDKRKQSFDPTVDATDPYGELLGSVSIVGDFGNCIESFKETLERRVSNPDELHDDAPEIAIQTPIQDTDNRQTYAEVVRSMCRAKGLDATRESVSLFEAFARTPYDVAHAIGRGLQTESERRKIRIAEVRQSLASLPASRLLNDEATPGVRAMTKGLLVTQEPLTRSELADKASVSSETVRRHLGALLGSGIATETDGQVRLALSFNTDEERHTDRRPAFMNDDLALVQDSVFEVFEYLDELTDEVISVWVAPNGAPDLLQLVDSHPWVGWLIELVKPLTEETPQEPRVRSITFGSEIEQTPVYPA